MKELKNKTRKELIEIIVNDQIKRGIVKSEKKEMHINARLKGCGMIRPMGWLDLYELVIELGLN